MIFSYCSFNYNSLGVSNMESIIVIVGFLGAGKTTLMKRLINDYLQSGWSPYVILNDYENADLDSQQFLSLLGPGNARALSGSCICCSGVNELRRQVNEIPKRSHGITFIEANGTSDAVTLMEFLGVGLNKNFLPPVQISVVDAKNWQKRGDHNELEANQVQVSSLVILNHLEGLTAEQIAKVKNDITYLNPSSTVKTWQEFQSSELIELKASSNQAEKMEHLKAHWSSCSVSLPDPLRSECLRSIIESLPKSILRVKGCTKLDNDSYYSYFEKIPAYKDTIVRPYSGALVSGPTLLVVGPGSNPEEIKKIIQRECGKMTKFNDESSIVG